MTFNLLIYETEKKEGRRKRKKGNEKIKGRHTLWPFQHVVAVCPKLYVRHKRHGSPVELDGFIQTSTLFKLNCFVEQFCSLCGEDYGIHYCRNG